MARNPLFYHLINCQFLQVLDLLLLQFDHGAYSFLKDSVQFLSWHSDPHYIMPVPHHALLFPGVFLSHGTLTKQ